MPTIEDKIIGLRNDLLYPSSDEGLCAGIGMTAVQAFCLDKALVKADPNINPTKEFDKYCERINYIDKHYQWIAEHIEIIRKKIIRASKRKSSYQLTPHEWDILDIAAFIDALDAYTNARDHLYLFDKKIRFPTAIDTAEFMQSNKLKAESELKLFDHIMQVYDKKSLERFVETLIQTLKEIPTDLSLYIGTGTHRFTICYDKSLQAWRYIDQKYLPPSLVTDKKIKDTFLSACLANDHKPMCLSIQSFGSENRSDELKQFTKKLHENLDAIGLDALNPKLCNSLNNRGKSITWMAARYNDIETLQRLAQLKNENGEFAIDFNLPNSNGVTPISQAIAFGNFEVIQFFANLKFNDGTRVIDLNQKYDGEPLLHTLVYKDKEDIIDYLLSLTKPDGTHEIDLRTVNQFNEDVVTFALVNNKFHLASKFLNLKDADGEYRLDPKMISQEFIHYALIEAAINRDCLLDELKAAMAEYPKSIELKVIKDNIKKDFCDNWGSFKSTKESIYLTHSSNIKFEIGKLKEIKKRKLPDTLNDTSNPGNEKKAKHGSKDEKKDHTNIFFDNCKIEKNKLDVSKNSSNTQSKIKSKRGR